MPPAHVHYAEEQTERSGPDRATKVLSALPDASAAPRSALGYQYESLAAKTAPQGAKGTHRSEDSAGDATRSDGHGGHRKRRRRARGSSWLAAPVRDGHHQRAAEGRLADTR